MKKILCVMICVLLCFAMSACESSDKNSTGDGKPNNSESTNEPAGTEGLEYLPLPDGNYAVAVGTARLLEEIVIPAEHNGKAVTKLAPQAFGYAVPYNFSGCTRLKSITIPDSVTEIGENAFYGCTSLESVTIPDGVTKIGQRTFEDCTSLKSVTIPDSVTEIGEYAFAGCASLKSVTIPDSVTEIDAGAFLDCDSLESVTIPDGAVVAPGAFDRGTKITRK